MRFEEMINEKGKLVYTNVGVSMLPWIHEGKDIIVIERISAPLKKYDAVLFIRPNVVGRGKYVLHRILKCYKDGTYYIQGDNLDTGELVRREDIIGILTEIHQPDHTIKSSDQDYKIKVIIWWKFILPLRRVWRKFKKSVRPH